MKAYNIKWDLDDTNVVLPSEVDIPSELIEEAEWDYDDLLDKVSDYLSDITGFCHNGFEIEGVDLSDQ